MLISFAVDRVVHLKLVSNISTESCLFVLRRSVSRRGLSDLIYLNNTKTFKPVAKEINAFSKLLGCEEVQSYVSEKRIK